MPDFTSDTFNGVKPVSPKKLTSFAPPNLSTFSRGTDKLAKLDEKVKSQQKQLDQEFVFRATPIKGHKNVAIPDRVKSDRKPTRAVGISLASQDRSVKRDQFDEAMREKERV